jgi:hypothetical protein
MASTDLPATLVQQIACNVLSVAAAVKRSSKGTRREIEN